MEKEDNKKKILYSEIVGSRKNYNMCWIDEYKMIVFCKHFFLKNAD